MNNEDCDGLLICRKYKLEWLSRREPAWVEKTLQDAKIAQIRDEEC